MEGDRKNIKQKRNSGKNKKGRKALAYRFLRLCSCSALPLSLLLLLELPPTTGSCCYCCFFFFVYSSFLLLLLLLQQLLFSCCYCRYCFCTDDKAQNKATRVSSYFCVYISSLDTQEFSVAL